MTATNANNAAAADDEDTDLTVMVCSANVGNAEPTPESFGEWVPEDGEISGPLSSTKYPVNDDVHDGASGVRDSLLSDVGDGSKKEKFDIIVIGMQEAAFVDKSLKRKGSSGTPGGGTAATGNGDASGEADNSDGQEHRRISDIALHPVAAVAAAGEAVHEVGHEIKKEGKKGGNKVFRKIVKANMVVRGLTTSQTYKAPELQNTHAAEAPHSRAGNVKENAAVRSGPYDTRKFLELIEHRCPSYTWVTSKLRGEMRLIVLAKKELAREIRDVYIAGENTGIGGVMANKGGIIATFDLRSTRLSFMTCHLEAHEGVNHYINRNKNLAEIFQGAKTDPNYSMHDATVLSHHMFVCGDLNYRIKFDDGDGGEQKGKKKKGRVKGARRASGKLSKKMMSKALMLTNSITTEANGAAAAKAVEEAIMEEEGEDAEEDISRKNSPPLSDKLDADASNRSSNNGDNSNPDEKVNNTDGKSAANGTHFTLAKSLVDAEDWKTLNDGDELAVAIEKKECLAGFKTLPCNFPPTFKVARCEGYSYNKKRTPSYTDRILWKSAHGMEDNVVPFLYEPCPDFITSDHKPIRGGYKVKMNKGPSPPRQAPLETSCSGRKVHLLVSNIKGMNLPIMDTGVMGGLSDPYILFVSYPKNVLWKNSWPSTKVVKRDLNPEWKEDIHFILDSDALCGERGGQISLAGVMLYMTVLDKDISSGDDVIGTVALDLSQLCSDLDIQGRSKKDQSSSGVSKSTGSTISSLNVQNTAISQPILRNGQEFGTLECTISSAYLEGKHETKAFLKQSRNKVRAKRRQISFTNRISSIFPCLP